MSIRPTEPRPFAFTQGRIVALEVEQSLYSAAAILRTCYKLSDRLYSYITPASESPDTLVVALWRRDGGELDPSLLGELCNELADQELRVRLARDAAPIRELIVTQAFSEGSLLSAIDDEADYEADPLRIATDR